MLLRAWLFLGLISRGARDGRLLLRAAHGRLAPRATRPATGDPLHHAYLQATTMTFVGIVACQIGTAFAARTERASLRSVGVFSNRLLLWGIAFELVLRRRLRLRTAASSAARDGLASAAGCSSRALPVLVWGADELRRWYVRRRAASVSRTVPGGTATPLT